MGKLKKLNFELMVSAIMLIIIGIAFCFSLGNGETLISQIIGVAFIVSGAINIVILIIAMLPIASSAGMTGGILIAIGIFLYGNTSVINAIINLVPWLVTILGAVFIADAVVGIIQKRLGFAQFLISLIIGAVTLTLGICFLTIDSFRNVASLIFGIIMIIYGVFQLISAIFGPKALIK